MFDPNKEYTIGVCAFMVIGLMTIKFCPDGQTMQFSIPNYDLLTWRMVRMLINLFYAHRARLFKAGFVAFSHCLFEDCPEEYRTKWFNPALEEAYSFLQKMSGVSA